MSKERSERAGYTVTMFIIDVSPSMGETRTIELPPGPNGETRTAEITNLEWALKYVKRKIQQMIFSGRKTDRCGVILFGTEGTDNPVSDKHGGYDNVTEYLPIQQPNARTLRKIDSILPSTVIGDPIDGIIVALSAQQMHLENKPSWTRKAVLITDGQNPIEVEDEDLSGTAEKINQWKVDMTVIGVDFDDENLPYEEPDKSDIKRANEEFYHKFVDLLDSGGLGTCEYALIVSSEPDIKVIRSTLMPSTLTIGDIQTRTDEAITIDVKMAKATAKVTPPSLKKFAKRQGDNEGTSGSLILSGSQMTAKQAPGLVSTALEHVAPLEMRTQYVVKPSEDEEKALKLEDDEDEDSGEASESQQRLEKEDLTRAYKYGLSWIPIEDESEASLSTLKGLEILGFSYEHLWTREWSMGEVYYIFPHNDIPRSQVAFSSLVRAMHDNVHKGELAPVLAIIRRVTMDGGPPKMGVARARSIENIDYLVWVQMPFAEDLRRFSFPSLEIMKDRRGVQKKVHNNLPTESMMEAMGNLVDACDLTEAGPKDEDGTRLPWFDPSEAVHPAVHRVKEAIFHAAVTTEITQDPLPPPHPDIIKFFERPKRVANRSRGATAECRTIFNVSKAPPRLKAKKRKEVEGLSEDANVPFTLADLMMGDAFISTVNQTSTSSGATSVPTITQSRKPESVAGSDATEDMDIDEAPSHVRTRTVGEGAKPGRIIGNSFPLLDFHENLSRGDVVSKAISDMALVIPEIVAESFSSQRFNEAIECMKAMRHVALTEDEVDEWNIFLQQFKKTCRLPSFKNGDFWDRVKGVGKSLSLIDEDEAQTHGAISDVSANGALRFVSD